MSGRVKIAEKPEKYKGRLRVIEPPLLDSCLWDTHRWSG